MNIGYARVSTGKQDLDVQLAALRACKCDIILSEKESGKTKNRPELIKALNTLNKGDTFIIYKIDRLSRSALDLLTIVKDVHKIGADFKSLMDPLFDTTTAYGTLIFQLMGVLAEFERNMISERTKKALAYKKSIGIKLGRRPYFSDDKKAIARKASKMRKAGYKISKICNELGLARYQYYSYLKQIGK